MTETRDDNTPTQTKSESSAKKEWLHPEMKVISISKAEIGGALGPDGSTNHS
jgi:hypothetical protein